MVVPDDRQAGAQGVLGGIQTLVAGIAAPVIGFTYEHAGRAVAYPLAAGSMVALLGAGLLLAGRPAWSMREARAADPDLADVTVPVLPEHPRPAARD
jgi:hypothetical protein